MNRTAYIMKFLADGPLSPARLVAALGWEVVGELDALRKSGVVGFDGERWHLAEQHPAASNVLPFRPRRPAQPPDSLPPDAA